MPTYQDIFLLKIILDRDLVTSKELQNFLCQLYQCEIKGKFASLANILNNSNLITKKDLQNAIQEAQDAIAEIGEQTKLSWKITAGDCTKQNILAKNTLSSTYCASHSKIGKCVLKYLEGALAKTKNFRHNFFQKLDRLTQFQHPNWGRVYATDISTNCIIRDFVTGESVADILLEDKVPLLAASQIIYQVSLALHTAYQQGLLHKNIKPSNIFVTNDGQAIIVDAYMPATIPEYLAPEQWKKKGSDVRSDIYSLGVVYYQMLTNTLPVSGKMSQEIAQQYCQGEYTGLRSQQLDMPELVEKIVKKMLELNPEERYQDYAGIIIDLAQYLGISSEASFNPTEPELELEPELEPEAPLDTAPKQDVPTIKPKDEETDEEAPLLEPQEEVASSEPSVDVIKHQRGKRIAEEIAHDIFVSFTQEIAQACENNSFYEDLKYVLDTARKKFQNKMKPVSTDGMPYLEEAFEKIRIQTMKELKKKTESIKPTASVKKTDGFEELAHEISGSMPAVSVDDAGEEVEQWAEPVDTSFPSLPEEKDFEIAFQNSSVSEDSKESTLASESTNGIQMSATEGAIQTSDSQNHTKAESENTSKTKLKPKFLKPKVDTTPSEIDSDMSKTQKTSSVGDTSDSKSVLPSSVGDTSDLFASATATSTSKTVSSTENFSKETSITTSNLTGSGTELPPHSSKNVPVHSPTTPSSSIKQPVSNDSGIELPPHTTKEVKPMAFPKLRPVGNKPMAFKAKPIEKIGDMVAVIKKEASDDVMTSRFERKSFPTNSFDSKASSTTEIPVATNAQKTSEITSSSTTEIPVATNAQKTSEITSSSMQNSLQGSANPTGSDSDVLRKTNKLKPFKFSSLPKKSSDDNPK